MQQQTSEQRIGNYRDAEEMLDMKNLNGNKKCFRWAHLLGMAKEGNRWA